MKSASRSALFVRLIKPFRQNVVRLRRGSLLRSFCVLILKIAARLCPVPLYSLVQEIRPLDVPDISFEPVDSQVMDSVFWFGVQGYEGRVGDIWTTLCRDARVILEIGGNVGLFTVLGARSTNGTYTVLEPVPNVAAILERNLRRNKQQDRVTLIQAAAVPDSTERIVALNVPNEHRAAPVGAHLLAQGEVSGRSSQQILQVRGLPFRQLLVDCDLVKIDAEGIEADLLESAYDLILRKRPIFLIEVLPESRRLGQLLATLARDVGYTLSIIPEYGSDRILMVTPEKFSSDLPARHNSKDVVLSFTAIA